MIEATNSVSMVQNISRPN